MKDFKDVWSNALAYRRTKLSQDGTKNKKLKTEKD